MISPKFKKNLLSQPRVILVIFLTLAVLMISSALIELRQSKMELQELMSEQASSLLESIIIASNNSLKSYEQIENIYRQRLLNNANMIKILYEKGGISNNVLKEFSEQNDIFRINIFNRQGQKLYSSHSKRRQEFRESIFPIDELKPILEGQTNTLIIGIKRARFGSGYRFAVAVAAKNGSVISLNIDAEELIRFRRETGFGVLLRKVIENPQIIYTALQDTNSILAASGNIHQLESINQSPFLKSSLSESVFLTRTTEFDTLKVFEAVKPFVHNEITVGLFRIGISLDPLEQINERIYRRLILITIILIFVGSIFFTFIFLRQRYDLLKKQYQVVETYSSNILSNVSDAIIVFDKETGIKIFNKAAEKLLQKNESDMIGKLIHSVLPALDYDKILSHDFRMQQIDCKINNQNKYFFISKSIVTDTSGLENTILVIRDLSEQKKLEDQIHRENRLTAMGELASGVAHEIRNPLNTISTIIQQLGSDFQPANEKEEYQQLTDLVYKEVNRINKTVEDFLRFARPEPVHRAKFPLKDFINQIHAQYKSILSGANIKIEKKINWSGDVFWDQNQMQQVFINLIQNASDAIDGSGTISIETNLLSEKELEILISDNGSGMSESTQANIFNLYFTTKAKGTGIGLSIVQRIIFEHEGVISVDSQTGKGTVFSIKMPIGDG